MRSLLLGDALLGSKLHVPTNIDIDGRQLFCQRTISDRRAHHAHEAGGVIVKLTVLPRAIAALIGPIAARQAAARVGYGPMTLSACAINQAPSLGMTR
jgi:hypothetical protein